jgi:hypothetical protein
VYWYGDNCLPCRAFEQNVLSDSAVQEALNRDFVCVKVNAERLNRTVGGKQRLKTWRIESIPQIALVAPDWKTGTLLRRTNDPNGLLEQLVESQRSSTRSQISNRPVQVSRRVPIRTAQLRTLARQTQHGEINAQEFDAIPLESSELKKPINTPVYYVQYGLAGSYSPYGISGDYGIVMNGGYRSNGGRYTSIYGPAVGSIVYPRYQLQSAYYQPPMHYQPMRYRGYYRGEPTMVCGPWGCALR